MEYSKFEQVQSERDIKGSNFTKGNINFIWTTDGPKYTNPFRSYFRVRCRLSRGNTDNPLQLSDGIAPNMFLVDNLIQHQRHYINGVQVSETQDYIPQLSALHKRINYNEQMLETLGSKTMFSQANIHERINEVSSDGKDQLDMVCEQSHPGDQESTIAYTAPSVALSIANLNTQARNGRNLDAADTIQIIAAANTAVWADNALGDLVDISDIYNIGDIVSYVDAANAVGSFVINSFAAALTANISSQQGIANSAATAIGANHLVFRHYRRYQDGGDLVGLNTLFETELEIGDEILNKDNNEQYKVITITDDTNITVFPPPRDSFAATDNWCKLNKNNSRQVKDFELIWKPCMGFYYIDDWIQGKHKLEITPHAQGLIQQYAIEALTNKQPNLSVPANGDFTFEMTDMLMYVYTGYSEKSFSGSKSYSFTEMRAQSQTLTTSSLTDKTFIVNPNTHALTLFYQDSRAPSDDTRFSRSKFTIEANQELNLSRYYIKYHGHFLPNPSADPEFDDATNKDFTTQNYYEMLMYSGAALLKSDVEDLNRWQERGPYYHYKWPKSVRERTERVYVSSQFSEEFIDNKFPNIFLVDHYLKNFTLKCSNGYVQEVTASRPVN